MPLEAFLDHPSRPDGTLGYHELQGFLFTIVCAPELVPPSEWLPVIFGNEEAGFVSPDEAEAIHEVFPMAVSQYAHGPDDP